MSDELLSYPRRRYGMDHDRYRWSMLQDRAPIVWPDNKPLALWINLSVQHFPLSGEKHVVAPPGALTMPYPDLRHYTLRDYGNRVGIFRILTFAAVSGDTLGCDFRCFGTALSEAYGAAGSDRLRMAGSWLEHVVYACR